MQLNNGLKILTLMMITTIISGCLPQGSGGGKKSHWLNQVTIATPTATATATATATPSRPSGVVLEADYCACMTKLSYSLGNCDSFCSDKNDSQLTLYVNVTLGDEIVLNGMSDLKEWCTKELNTTDTSPGCRLDYEYNNSTQYLEMNMADGSAQFSVNISSLSYNRTYLLNVEETTSGVKSSTIQLRLKEPVVDEEPLGPLQITPMNLYTCITRSGTTVSGSNYYAMGAMSHYYYPDNGEPPNLSGSRDFLFCHDINKYGLIDHAEYPRLMLDDSFMHFWAESDIRFYDQDLDGKLDVNNYIENKLLSDYGVSGSSINIFVEFDWFNYPMAESAVRMGYIMQPWVDSGGDPFCPTTAQYETSEPVFQILKDLVGTDTEALYLAVKESESITDSNGTVTDMPPDYLLIREGLLKQLWFYLSNGTPIPADENASQFKTVMFYWPPDTTYPLVKKSYQRTYTVRAPSQISDSSNDAVTGLRTVVTPSDKRIGCVPKMQ